MNKEQAIGILMQVAEMAQGKGILSLDDAVLVKKAFVALQAVEEPQKEETLTVEPKEAEVAAE